MQEFELNQRAAEHICQHLEWQGQSFRVGVCVSLLNGEVVSTEKDLDCALTALRNVEPDINRGMVFEVTTDLVDVIR